MSTAAGREGRRAFRVSAWSAETLGWTLFVLVVNEGTVRLGLFPSIWPTSGVILALLLFRGVSRWPAPFLALWAELALQPLGLPALPVATAFAMALGWTGTHALVALALRRAAGGRPELHTLRDVVLFVVLAGAAGPALRLAVGAVFGPPLVEPTMVLRTWAADTAGSLVIAPPLLRLLDRHRLQPAGGAAEAVACGALLLAVAAVVFGPQGNPTPAYPPLYLLWIPLTWAALRFGVGGAALGSLAVATVALATTAVASTNPAIAAFRLQLYLGVMTVCMLVLGAVVEERAAAGRRLADARRELDGLLRRRIREEREERDFGRLVLETARALVVTIDGEGRLGSANPAFRDLTGKTPAELSGVPLRSLVSEDERPHLAPLLEQLWRADAIVAFTLALSGPAGERRDLQWTGRCLDDPVSGTRRLLLAGLEVTRQRRARREVERSLALVRTTLESIAEGILVVAADGDRATWNANFAGHWGIPVQPDRGPAAAVFARLREAAADPAAVADAVRRLGPATDAEEEGTLSLRDGRVFEWVSRPQRLGPRIVGRVWSFQDVTVRVRTAAERARLLDRTRRSRLAAEVAAAQALRAVAVRDDFLSVASHELRSPLTSMKAHLQRVRRLAASVPAVRASDVVSVVPPLRRQLGRLRLRLEEILEVGAFAAGEPAPYPVAGDLRDVARKAIAQHEEEAFRYRTPVRLLAPEPVPGVWDAPRLSRALGALISNAVKFGAGRPVAVEIRRLPDGRAAIAVRDRGPGIEPADRERIFQRFERSVQSRHYGGFGLGLWFARRIVEASGGEIAVESDAGNGATFTIVLPVHAEVLEGAGGEAR